MNHLRLMARCEERRSERERGLRDLGKREGAPHLSRVARLAPNRPGREGGFI